MTLTEGLLIISGPAALWIILLAVTWRVRAKRFRRLQEKWEAEESERRKLWEETEKKWREAYDN